MDKKINISRPVLRPVLRPDPHQIEALNFMLDRKAAALFLGMSLSKTAVAMAAIDVLMYDEAAISKVIVIAPKKVAGFTWVDEFNKWEQFKHIRYKSVEGTASERIAALRSDADVYLLGVDNLLSFTELYKRRKTSKGLPVFDCFIIDESSLFKNPKSKRFKAFSKWRASIEYRYILTGTPAPNELTDLWAQIFLLDDGKRLGAKFGAFTDKYFIAKGDGMNVFSYIPKALTHKQIPARIKDIALTMETRGILKDMPDLEEIDVELDFDPYDRDIYDELEREFVIEFFEAGETGEPTGLSAQPYTEITAPTAASLSVKLLQLTSGAVYDENKVAHTLNTLKLDEIERIITSSDETFMLAYFFKHELTRIKERFPFARVLKTRQDFEDWNAGKIKLLCIHPAGAGHGLNLQFGGRNLIWFTLTWNLEHYLQTVARLLRRSQPFAVRVYRLLVNGTRDHKVAKAILRKEGAQSFLMREIKELRAKYYGSTRKFSR